MSATISKPYDWLKQFPSSIFKLDADSTPLFGKGPAFPWEDFSKSISKIFNLKESKIEPSEMQWREPEKLTNGLGANVVSYAIQFSQFEGTLYWAMSSEQIEKLMKLLLVAPTLGFNAIENNFAEGFYNFVLGQALKCINESKFIPNLGAGIEDKKDPAPNPSYCTDISLFIKDDSVKGRVIFSQEFMHSWKEKHADRSLDSILNHPLASKITTAIHLEIGKTQLFPAELQELSLGDYLVLDSCSYEPDSDKGRLMMTLDGRPLFRAKLKQGSLKILEFPLYQEDTLMKNEKNHDEENESELEDLESDFEETEEELTEEESILESEEELTENEEFEETEDEDLEDEAEETEDEEDDDDEVKDTTKKEKEVENTAPPVTDEEKREKNLKTTLTNLPVNVVIEIGRIQLSVQQLSELQPGNMLEVDIHPENGVDLVVNGKRIGKGELLKIGDVIGVRILDLG